MSANIVRKRIIRNLQYLSSRKYAPTQEVLDIISFTEVELERLQEEDAFPLEELIKISEYSGVSLDEIFKKELEDLHEKKEAALLRHLKPEEEDDNFEVVEIPFISTAAASEYIGGGDWKDFPSLKLPKRLFPAFQLNSYASFEVEGDSMLPEIEPGSIIIGERVEKPSEFKDGWRYVVVHLGGIHFKRLYRADDFDYSNRIRMVSENLDSHPDFFIEMNNVRELWRPHQIISKTL